jgi:AcrR family transcriptional regulator
MTQPLIYRYFRDKEDLLMACCTSSAEQGRNFIDSGIDQTSSARDRLRSYVRGNLLWVVRHRKNAYCLLAMYYFGSENESIKELHWKINSFGIERINVFLVQIAHEEKKQKQNTMKVAKDVHSFLSGEIIKAFHWPNEESERVRFTRVWNAINILLDLN